MKTLPSSLAIYLLFWIPKTEGQHAKGIYAELLGATFFYSANFDIRFIPDEDAGPGFRIGFFYLPDDIEDYYSGFPVQLNYLFGQGRSKLELGAGITYYVQEGPFSNHQILPSGVIMYRWQQYDRGLLFRGGLSPLFLKWPAFENIVDGPPPFWFWFTPGISIGYKF